MAYLDALQSGDYDVINYGYNEATSLMNLVLDVDYYGVTAQLMCVEKMFLKMNARDYFYCALCDTLLFTARQFFIHSIDTVHLQKEQDAKTRAVLPQITYTTRYITGDTRGGNPHNGLRTQFKAEELAFVVGLAKKYSKINTDTAPFVDFDDTFTAKYDNAALFDYVSNIASNRAQIIAKLLPRLKSGQFIVKMMSEINNHIGDNQTRCKDCRTVTGTRDEYYKHLRTYSHLKKSNSMDLITFVVNVSTKENDNYSFTISTAPQIVEHVDSSSGETVSSHVATMIDEITYSK